jgi:predicted nucleotidyltransferase
METALSDFFRTARLPEVQAAILFGSHAHDRVHADSDVDVAVLLDRVRLPGRSDRADFAERLGVRLIEALHQNRVDVVVLNDAPPELAVAALDGAVLHVSAPGTFHDFGRDARLRLADIRPFLDRTRRLLLDAVTR